MSEHDKTNRALVQTPPARPEVLPSQAPGASTLAHLGERRRRLRPRRESDERLRAYYDNLPIAAYWWRRVAGEFVLVDCNRTAEAATSGPLAPHLGKTAYETYPDMPDVLADLERCLIQGMSIKRELHHRAQSTSEASDLAFTYVFVPPDSVVMHIEDIGERKRAEAALRESEERFRSLVEGSIEGIIIHVDRKPVFANQAYADMLGYRSPQEILAAESVDDFIAFHERERLRAYNDARLHGEDAPTLYEFEGLRKHGSTVTLQNAVRVVQWKGAPAVQSTVIDISQRKQAEAALRESEERFRTVFQISPIGIVILSPEGRIIRANPAFQAMLGYGAEELRQRSIRDIVWREDARRTERLLTGIVAGRRSRGRLEKRYVHKEGGAIWASAAVSAMRAETGEVKYVVALVENIDQRKKAETLLRRSRAGLRNLAASLQAAREQERAAIAREIHDELGQTLTGLKLDLGWLRERLAAPDGPLTERVDSMLALSDATLDTVRRLSTRLRPPMLDDLGLEAAIEWQVQEFASRSGCRCELRCDIVELAGDPERDTAIFRIVQEALTNIARHARAHKVRIALRTARGQLLVQVSDDGVGISPSAITSSQSLGLVGMTERARAFGGRLNIEPLPVGGTRITLKMPLKRKQEVHSL